MGINRVEELNKKLFDKRQEVEIFLNNLNNISENRIFSFDIEEIRIQLRGLIDKFSRDTIRISILSEVSSGKSTFLNALIFNKHILESKIGETTAKIFHIKYGKKYTIDNIETENIDLLKKQIEIENSKNLTIINNESKDEEIANRQSVITLPNENLKKGIELYDTPGFASIKEVKIINLLKDVVSKSDATILLLDISQGIKESERLFIRTMLNNIQINKRFIVLNKYDTIVNEDDFEIKSKEEIEEEINALIKYTESTLQKLQNDTSIEINSFHLSAKKALVAKIKNNKQKLEESRFSLFEEYFWERVTQAKDETFEDNINLFNRVQKKFKELLKEELNLLYKKRKESEVKQILLLDSQNRIVNLNKEIERLRELNNQTKELEKNLAKDEKKVIENSMYMLNINFASEINNIGFLQKLILFRLKNRYQKSVLSVMKEGNSYIIQNLNYLIDYTKKDKSEMESIVENINQNLTRPLWLSRTPIHIEAKSVMDKVIYRIKGYVGWDNATLFALLKNNIIEKDNPKLKLSCSELTYAIHDMKRACSNTLLDKNIEREKYIVLIERDIEKIKIGMNESHNLKEDIKNIVVFIDDIRKWIE